MTRRLMTFLCGLCLALAMAHAQQADTAYRLGPEDIFSLTVMKHPEFSGTFLVPPDGLVEMPVCGKIQVSGKTVGELTALVREGLRGRLRQPEVVITLSTLRMQRIYVLGAVARPGVFDLKEGWRVTEALAAAGGALNTSAQTRIAVMRGQGVAQSVDWAAILRDGASEANVRLAAGDVVIVEQQTARIAVLGHVNRPGYYDIDISRPMRLSDAVSLAGGADTRRGQLRSVALLRSTGGKQQRQVCDLDRFLKSGDASQNPEIAPGDIVFVPETKKIDWAQIFQAVSVLGIVGNLIK